MFKIAEKRTVRWPVTVSYPQDNGLVKRESFDVEFEVVTQNTMDSIVLAGVDLLDRVVTGWPDAAGPTDSDGNRVAFSEGAKADLINLPYARRALFDAYSEVQQGRAAARKNA